MIQQRDDGYWIHLRENIALHHEDVFACLTTSEGLSRWFPVAAKVDLRSGGRIVFCWDANCRSTSTIDILAYDAGGTVVWDWRSDAHDLHVPVHWSVLPDHEVGSRVELRQGPFPDSRDGLIAMAEEAEGWRWQLCNLRSVLEVKHDMRAIRPI